MASNQAASNQDSSTQDASNQEPSHQEFSHHEFSLKEPSNQAAWFTGKYSRPLKVGIAPFTPPSAHQIVVRNGAVAINPAEWMKQLLGRKLFSWIKCPFVLGNDCAGEVVQVGDKVSGVKVGDRVLAHALSMDPAINNSSEGAFQHYTVIRDNMVSVIPDWLSYEEACVVPLGLTTAATALFQRDFLGLKRPGTPMAIVGPELLPEVVVIWGGSTSVGCNAIQLAASAGYDVITTCSPKNFEYLTSLGAAAVFDYSDQLTIQQIVDFVEDRKVVGAIAIGKNSTEACIAVLGLMHGSKFVARVSWPFPETMPMSITNFSIWSDIKIRILAKRCGVKTKFVSGSSAAHNEVAAMVYTEFLPEALATGAFVAAPKPRIMGKGLDRIQSAIKCHMRGVSAQKVVVSL
ncbi:unnamed protein product [Penicillium glandicola]